MVTNSVLRIAGVCLLTVVLFSCKKDFKAESETTLNKSVSSDKQVKRAYHDNFDTYYQFIPDIQGGWTPPNPGPAWYPGGGEGHATHVGNAGTYFNQYATLAPTGLVTAHAPVTMFFATELQAFNLPSNVGSVVFDDKGNAIWFSSLQTGGSQATPVSPTRVNFTATLDIVGGNGKFSNATGQVIINGFFNPQDQQDAGYSQDGWIAY